MSVIGGEYPEERPDDLPELQATVDPVQQARHAALNYSQAITGNLIEATTTQDPRVIEVADQVQSRFTKGRDTLARYAEQFIRQTQALEAWGGVFFEGINRAQGELLAFTNRDETAQLVHDGVAGSIWRERIEDHDGSLAASVPGVTTGVKILVSPRIRTEIPYDSDSERTGYLNSTGVDFKEIGGISKVVSPSNVATVPAPILSKIENRSLSSGPPDEALATDSPRYFRHASEGLHLDAYRSLAKDAPGSVVVADLVAVVPGIIRVGYVESVDMFIDLGNSEYSDASKPPGDYWVELTLNGRRQGGQLVSSIGSKAIGKSHDNPMIAMPPLAPGDPNKAFEREDDITLSISGIPVKKLSSKDQIDTSLPAVEHQLTTYGSTDYLQADLQRDSFIAHVSVSGSY